MWKLFGRGYGLIAVLLLGLAAGAAGAGTVGEAPNRAVIQVSSADPLTQKIALNNAANLQKALGMDNVDVEIVAYGPGLGLLTRQNKQSARVKSMAMQNVTFSACSNTMDKIAKKKGKAPELTEGVRVVPGGVVRIMELQQAGYTYIRP